MSRKKKEAPRKIAIIGTAPSSIELAPYDDLDWEIWGCSPGTVHMKRIDTFFELHRFVSGGVSFPLDYIKYLAAFDGTVWMTVERDEIPNSKEFPWQELVGIYGPYFFTSSIAWMMAMAIEMRPSEISLYGIDMGATTEYFDQKLGCQYFATLAKARGIDVYVPPESDLLRPNPLYGVCQNSHAWIKDTTKLKEYNAKQSEAEENLERWKQETIFWKGAQDDLDYHMKTWTGGMEMNEYTSPPEVPALAKP